MYLLYEQENSSIGDNRQPTMKVLNAIGVPVRISASVNSE
jgi:hypothetical protein